MEIDALLETRLAATVTRYHSERLIREQSVGEHTYNVVCLIYYLMEGKPPANLVQFALFHDVPEYRLGDAPAPVKWNYKALKDEYIKAEVSVWKELGVDHALGPGLELILKAADSFECALYSIEEAQTGNVRMLTVATRALAYLDSSVRPQFSIIWKGHSVTDRFLALYRFCRSRL